MVYLSLQRQNFTNIQMKVDLKADTEIELWLTEHRFDDALLDTPDQLIAHLTEAARAMMPFSHWCNRGLME